MFPVQLKPGEKYKLFDEVYTILKRLPDLKIEAEEERFKTIKIFTYTELVKHLSNGDLMFECIGKNVVNNIEPSIKTSFFIENIKDSKHKERAIFRFEIIKPLLKVSSNQRNCAITSRVEEVNAWSNNAQAASEKLNGCTYYQTVSYTSVYRWLKDYRESNNDIRALFPSYHSCGGKDKSRFEPQVIDFIKETITESYNNKERITVRELWFYVIHRITELNKFSVKQLEIPPYSSIARYITKVPEYELVAKRMGKREAEKQYQEVGNGIHVYHPLERVEIDHTPIDVILVDENKIILGRPYLVLAIDKYSRQVLGFSIGISNGVGWSEVMQCIKHIMSDKSYVREIYPFIENEWTAFGLPQTIVVDNGLEFKNNAMKDAGYQLGFVLQFCPPRVPEWKGSIERFFGTANTGLFHIMPGTTRSNPTKLADGENPSQSACLTFSNFIAIVHKWIIDVYSQDLNKGAGGKPAAIWKKGIEEHPVAWPNSISEAAILLGRTAYRRISRRGIELDTLHYNSNELNKLLIQFTKENNGSEEDYLVKYDPQDLGEVYVYDHLINKKWVKVPCTNPSYARNLSEWEHKEIRAYARNEYGIIDIESLARAKFCIRKMIDNGFGYTEKEIARARKTTSEREIADRLKDNVKSIYSPSNNLLKNNIISDANNSSISDLGLTLTSSDVFIPESMTNEKNIIDDIKVIKMSTNNKKTKRDKTEKNLCENKIDQSSFFTADDFAGFGISSGISEVKFNE